MKLIDLELSEWKFGPPQLEGEPDVSKEQFAQLSLVLQDDAGEPHYFAITFVRGSTLQSIAAGFGDARMNLLDGDDSWITGRDVEDAG